MSTGERTRKLFIVGESTNVSAVLLCLRTVDAYKGKTGLLMKTERWFILAVLKKYKLVSLDLFMFEHDCFMDVLT